ncbi:hypothetical protein E4U45_000790 [Claviceps purpurea]|nr:hypothetical protein E4U45_000790 [Claviceps purpurea]
MVGFQRLAITLRNIQKRAIMGDFHLCVDVETVPERPEGILKHDQIILSGREVVGLVDNLVEEGVSAHEFRCFSTKGAVYDLDEFARTDIPTVIGAKRLRSSYLRANNGRDVGPSELIQAIDSALGEEASEFVCGNPLLDQIVDQADDFTATQDDLVMFENALRDRFDVDAEVEVAHDGPFPNVVQGDGESLDAYHGRVLAVFRARGGRDKPISPDQPHLKGSLL